jgi:hypothetical protein
VLQRILGVFQLPEGELCAAQKLEDAGVLLVEAGRLLVVLARVQEEALALKDDAQVRVDLGEEFGNKKLLKRTSVYNFLTWG